MTFETVDFDTPALRATSRIVGSRTRNQALHHLEVSLLDRTNRWQVIRADGDPVLLEHDPALERLELRQREQARQVDLALAEWAEETLPPRLLNVDLAGAQSREQRPGHILQVDVEQPVGPVPGEHARVAAADQRVTRVEADPEVDAIQERLHLGGRLGVAATSG